MEGQVSSVVAMPASLAFYLSGIIEISFLRSREENLLHLKVLGDKRAPFL